jgi:hypothetical protein
MQAEAGRRVMSNERRNENRELRCIPVSIQEQGDDVEHVAIVHDASAHGVTLYTREPHAIGERLLLELHTDVHSSGLPASGRVVHCERLDLERSDVWSWQLGMQLDTSLAPYEAAIEALTAKQRANGLLPN